MVGIGIGVGLGMSGQTPRQSQVPEDTIKAAIKQRNHIIAVRSGLKVFLQPYALLALDGGNVLRAVIVLAEGRADGTWAPETIPVSDLSGLKIYNETFIPSDAFDPEILAGVIAAVEVFDPFQDTSNSGTD